MITNLELQEVLSKLDGEDFANYGKLSSCFLASCPGKPTIHVLAKSRTYSCWVCEWHFKELSYFDFVEVKEIND